MPGRQYVNGEAYRYDYQGQEKDKTTNWNLFELRPLNPLVGRWYNPDPYGQFHSSYLAMGNNPISQIDPDGGYSMPSNTDIAIQGVIATHGYNANINYDEAISAENIAVTHSNSDPEVPDAFQRAGEAIGENRIKAPYYNSSSRLAFKNNFGAIPSEFFKNGNVFIDAVGNITLELKIRNPRDFSIEIISNTIYINNASALNRSGAKIHVSILTRNFFNPSNTESTKEYKFDIHSVESVKSLTPIPANRILMIRPMDDVDGLPFKFDIDLKINILSREKGIKTPHVEEDFPDKHIRLGPIDFYPGKYKMVIEHKLNPEQPFIPRQHYVSVMWEKPFLVRFKNHGIKTYKYMTSDQVRELWKNNKGRIRFEFKRRKKFLDELDRD